MKKEDVKTNFALLCDYAFFSDVSKLNLIGIFKKIVIPNPPAKHPQMFVVASFSVNNEGEGRNYEIIIKFLQKKGGSEIFNDLKFNLAPGREYENKKVDLGIIGRVNNIQFKDKGEYTIQISINGILIEEIPLTVE